MHSFELTPDPRERTAEIKERFLDIKDNITILQGDLCKLHQMGVVMWTVTTCPDTSHKSIVVCASGEVAEIIDGVIGANKELLDKFSEMMKGQEL